MIKPVCVVTAAGAGTRFSSKGYLRPKPLIELAGRPLLWWALKGFEKWFSELDIVIVTNPGDVRDEEVDETLAQLDASLTYRIAHTNALTRGQAETALIGIRDACAKAPLLVWNSDTALRGEKIYKIGLDNHLLCFPSLSPSMSYVIADKGGRVSEIAEKQVISSWACTGLYSFSSVGLFREAVHDTYDLESPTTSVPQVEAYVAPLYTTLLRWGIPVSASLLSTREVLLMGTPDELGRASSSRKWVDFV